MNTDWGSCRDAETLTVLPDSATATITPSSKGKSVRKIKEGHCQSLGVQPPIRENPQAGRGHKIRKLSGLQKIGAKVHEILAG
jgi:hypothetical protein